MGPIRLFPKTSNLVLGLGLSLAFLGIGAAMQFLVGTPDEDPNEIGRAVVSGVFYVVGVVVLLGSGRRLLWRRPVFVAATDHFSVNNGKKRPWSQFQGVQIVSHRVGFGSPVRSVIVRAGTSRLLSRKLRINRLHLPETAAETARLISGSHRFFAPRDPSQAQKPVPPQKVAPAPDTGPITSVRPLSERMFGAKSRI